MRLVAELRRRNVIRMAVLYAGLTWLILQIIDVVDPNVIDLPDGTGQWSFILLAVGFPIALLLAWFYRITPAGVAAEDDVAPRTQGRTGDAIAIAVLSAAVILFAVHTWWPRAPLEKSVAVLPLRTISSASADLSFSNGVHAEVIRLLRNVSSLTRIPAATTVEQYRDSQMSLPEIGQELQTATVVEGSIQRAGEKVRVTVQLIDTATGKSIWDEVFDRELTSENMLAIQSEIAREVVDALDAVISDDESRRLSAAGTDSLDAFAEYTLGQAAMDRRTRDSFIPAELHFRKAIDLDPNYALAYGGLADALAAKARTGQASMESTLDARSAAVEKGLLLAPELGELHVSQAVLYRHRDNDPAAAEQSLLRAIELSPNYPRAYKEFARLLWDLDRLPAALTYIQKGLDIDPQNDMLIDYYAHTLLLMGRYEDALPKLLDSVARNPAYLRNHVHIFKLLRNAGHTGEALKWVRHVTRNDPTNFGRRLHHECWVLSIIGYKDEAQACEQEVAEDFPEEWERWNAWNNDDESERRVVERIQHLIDSGESFNRSYALDLLVDAAEWDVARELYDAWRPPEYSDPDWIPRDIDDVNRGQMLASVLHNTGDVERAQRITVRVGRVLRDEGVTFEAGFSYRRIALDVALGNKGAAIVYLRDGMVDGGILEDRQRLKEPLFDVMLDESEWVELIAKLDEIAAEQRRWYEMRKDEPLLPLPKEIIKEIL